MGMPNLMDPVRNDAYEWILSFLPKESKRILDVGCRDSGFPSYLASLGHKVTSIERDDFKKQQESWNNRLKVKTEHITDDLLKISGKFDIVTAVYSLQHNVNSDMLCYRKCAELANTIYIVNEFNYNESRFQFGRDDGDLRIYSNKDLEERIITPINVIKKIKDIQYYPCKFVFEKQTITKVDIKEANTLGIKIEL